MRGREVKTYTITHASGAVANTQTLNDNLAPIVYAGQTAAPQAVGFNASSGSLSSVAAGASDQIQGRFNISIWGTFVATIRLEKSYDGGTNWIPVVRPSNGSTMQWTVPVATTFYEPEANVLYRLNMTARTSGTANWRLSQ